MTNTEFADTLDKLAAKYREDAEIEKVVLSKWAYDKEELAALLRGFGGRWIKHDDADTLRFTSDALPGLTLYIPRDKVCRKIVRYECDPIMSPAEEVEILQEVA